jgi:hypothetical protein
MSETLVTKALEARQNATDEARKLLDDGFPERAHIIMNALTRLDTCVIRLERELQQARAAIRDAKEFMRSDAWVWAEQHRSAIERAEKHGG